MQYISVCGAVVIKSVCNRIQGAQIAFAQKPNRTISYHVHVLRTFSNAHITWHKLLT
jgi:hypothetical protein